MSSNTYVNAAPMVLARGTQDLSKTTPVLETPPLPTHLPKVYLFASRGPTEPQLVVGNLRNNMYGDDTFDLRKPFATHQTVLSNLVNEQGNAQMIERIVPADNVVKANVLLSLEIAAAPTLPTYQRNTDGSYILDPVTNLPLVDTAAPTVSGFVGVWRMTSRATLADGEFGGALQAPGSLGSSSSGAGGIGIGKIYPVLEFEASSLGAEFNNVGLRMWAPLTSESTPVDSNALAAMKAFPYRLSAVRRATETATPEIVMTEYNEPYFDFTLNDNQINPLTNAKASLSSIFLDRFSNLKDTRFPIKYGDFANVKVYSTNIAEILALVGSAEIANIAAGDVYNGSDELGTVAKPNLNTFNLFTGMNSQGAPYSVFKIMSTGSLSSSSNING
jgi:hypothetical protein